MANTSQDKIKSSLNLFNNKYNKIVKTRFVKYLRRYGLEFSFDLNKDKPRKGNLRPKTDDIDAFVLTLRFFIQDNEPSSIRNLSKIYKNCPYIKLKNAFEKNRELLNIYLQTKIPFVINNKSLSFREILFGYVYSESAHSNKKKHRKFNSIYSTDNAFTRHFLEHYFISICIDVFRAVQCISEINIDYLKKIP